MKKFYIKLVSRFYTAKMAKVETRTFPFGDGEYKTHFTITYKWKYGTIVAQFNLSMFFRAKNFTDHYATLIENQSPISISAIKTLGKQDSTYWDYSVKFKD